MNNNHQTSSQYNETDCDTGYEDDLGMILLCLSMPNENNPFPDNYDNYLKTPYSR